MKGRRWVVEGISEIWDLIILMKISSVGEGSHRTNQCTCTGGHTFQPVPERGLQPPMVYPWDCCNRPWGVGNKEVGCWRLGISGSDEIRVPFLENHSQPGRIVLILLETKRSACQKDILKLSAYGNDGLQHLKHSFPFCFSCIYFCATFSHR